MQFFEINGTVIRAPTEIVITPEVLDKTERTMDGTMVVDIIGVKQKINVSWDYLSKADMTVLTKAIGGGTFAKIAYPQDGTGELITMIARAEGLTYQPHYDWAKGELMCKSVAVSFSER
ncbi:MAG: hypothetical protein K2K85_02030 [Clostridia bacterium]|nr:hypothetical protein [Clostridia bacterium]